MHHLALHWPAQATVSFWPQAIEYSVWVLNQMPNTETGISPNEIWSSVRSSMEEFSRAHVFGYPVYVLDAALQNGHKIPKWSPRARLGLFLGFSDLHSSQVPLVLNVQTGKISPKYHVIFDNKFETVNSLLATESLDKQWAQIFRLERECFLDVDYDKNGNAIQPLLSELIKNFSKANAKTPEFRPLPIFEPTQNPRENKDNDVSLLPQHRTPISDSGFQEIAAPRGATAPQSQICGG
jgi:hypothetical protein